MEGAPSVEIPMMFSKGILLDSKIFFNLIENKMTGAVCFHKLGDS